VATSRAKPLTWWFIVVATAIGLIAMHGAVARGKHQADLSQP
jgi:hypothetical protein